MRTHLAGIATLAGLMWGALILAPLAGTASSAHAQLVTSDHPLDQATLPTALDTGWVRNDGGARGPAYSAVITATRRPWIRLEFAEATLGRTPAGGQPTVLRITALLDGAVQTMTASNLQQWSNTTAYFNGSAVRIEIISDPGAPPSRLVMTQLMASAMLMPDDGSIASICGSTDDRVLSSEAGNARLLPSGCTAWLINDPNRTFLTAGHCGTSGTSVIQFNVPLSTSSGTVVHPPPEHQYAPDPASIQFTNGGVGSDWCYFGCFPNTNTNLTPFQAQGDFYTLAPNAPAVAAPAQTIRITGYGTVSSPVSPTWNQVQKTHSGPYAALVVSGAAISVRYATDTTGGNSGSPVFNLDDNTAIGIHTHAGCTSTGGSNQGTAIHNAGLQNALANPQGVCIPTPAVDFIYPDGRPANVSPFGDTLRVEVVPANGGTPQPGTGVLHVDTGAGYVAIPMNEISPNVYDAVFPSSACGAIVRYYLAAETTAGETIVNPLNAPAGNAFYSAISASDIVEVLNDNFQTDQGWIASNTASVTTGFWQRVVPSAGGTRGDPAADADGSGMCYVTDNGVNNDIDGGSVTLTSPAFDVTGTGAAIAYWRWFTTTTPSSGDTLLVQVSDNDGASWVNLETYTGTAGSWTRREYRIDQIAGITPTSQFRIRFTASDIGSASVVEAGIDGVRITHLDCGSTPCPADTDGSGAVDVDDLIAVILGWGPCPAPPAACSADVNASGAVDVDDLISVILGWGACP